ncbi:DNA processing protein DprA [Sinorhizobium americanum]|uniref:DNA processing protein DprA n=1 Tax=Sinorhizobium americanum TaxID=194963 RepID=A0A1L3LKZ8_9HYPH|nr:DNA processing protein DprA [Sinorhizobium americanum]
MADAERELEAAHRFGAVFVGIGEPDYPPALKEIDAAPPLLAMKGNIETASRASLGIVGSRNASVSGAKFAAMIARDAGAAGYVITSGLARGIDTAAHRASLESGTIAALAGGLDQPYSARECRPPAADHCRSGLGDQRNALRLGAPRPRLSKTEPPGRWHQSRRRHCRSRQPFGVAHHRPLRGRFRPTRLCRAGLTARSALSRHE